MKVFVPIVLGCLCLMGLLVAAVVGFFYLNRNHHQHCIVATGLSLQQYASDHQGNFPESTNGYGDAMLKLIREKYLPEEDGIALFTAPGGDPAPYAKALADGTVLKESDTSRVYVQGLNFGGSNGCSDGMSYGGRPRVQYAFPATVFDKNSNYGDHFGIYPFCWFKPKVREVYDSGIRVIPDPQWPAFVREQVGILRSLGMPDQQIEHYYPGSTRQ